VIVGLYLAAVVAANLSVAALGPWASVVNAFLFVGFDFTSRDRLHEAWRGRHLWLRMALLIAAGGVISYLLNRDALQIAVASTVAFIASASCDAIVYQLLRWQPPMRRINGSNVAGAAVDSVVFPTLAFGGLLPLIVLGQFAAKVLGGLMWSMVLVRREAAR
jgi:uncharacterized PurR-regulated membrane protein YhhQ (DUF165 family)